MKQAWRLLSHAFSRLFVRLLLLAGLMTVITLGVGVASFYTATSWRLLNLTAQMPPRARAEFEHLVATGRQGSDRYFELYDRYGGDEIRSTDWSFLAIIALLSTMVGGGAAAIVARRISRPVTAVAKAAKQVAAGELAVRVSWTDAPGEIGELVRSFNAMAGDIEAYGRERSVLTAGIAHELRTPLTILKGRLHGLADGVIDPATGEAGRLLRQVDQLSRLVEDLRTLAHAEAGELALDFRRIDLGPLAGAAVADLKSLAEASSVGFALRLDTAPVRADPVRVTQIVTNLITNAIKHSPAGGTIHVTAMVNGAHAIVSVADEGTGFLSEDSERMFLPFWRAAADRDAGRQGSGMGLALAARLAEAHGGSITASNRVGLPGAIFTLSLPRQS